MADPSNSFLPDKEVPHEDEGGIRIGDIYIPPPPLPSLTFDPTGPRLMISNIIIENFKSYGRKVALGPFQKNFSAIVGPNGSGKSNVIDAMLFVFGYRAQKIRSQTVGVLIHTSDSYPNLTSCCVAVHFQKIIDKEGTDYTVVPNSEFVISRTARKDNSSFYCINDRKVQFREVSKLLRSHGIDLDHNRFLILQGEVEQISLMKPKAPNEHETGMLEFLEDIIGSGRFKEPIELLSKKVEELNEQRAEKLTRVKAVQKEKDELEGPKDEALEFLNVKNQRVVKQHGMIQKFMYDFNIKIDETMQKKANMEQKKEAFMKGYDKIEEDIKKADKEQKTTESQYVKICKKEETLTDKFKKLELQDVQKHEELKHIQDRNKELPPILDAEKTKMEQLETAPIKLEEEITALTNKKVNELEPQKIKVEEAHQRMMANLQLETKDLQDMKDMHEAELLKMQQSLNEAKSKMGIAKVELDLYIKNAENEKQRLNEMQSNIERNAGNIKEMEREIRSLEKELPTVVDQLHQGRLALENIAKQEVNTVEEFQVKRAKMEEAKSTLNSSRNRGRLLEALMQEKNSGRISGIIGRLGDLGAIAEKYDIAISTACGALDNIVTDTMKTAEDCVAFLKRSNLGQATFICLDKMQMWNEAIHKPFTPPSGVCRMFDLIKGADSRILPAFYFALRDTLVADNINQATAIALQGTVRHRVVTLKGDLIEPFGTMSGGGSRPMKGRMGTSVVSDLYTPQQIEEMEREVSVLHETLTGLTQRKYKLQEEITEQDKKVSQMKHALEKYKMEIQVTKEQQQLLKSQLKDQEDRVRETTPDETKVNHLTERLNKAKEEFSEVDGAAAKIKLEVQKLHNEIIAISGGKIKNSQKRVKDINKEIDEVVSTINKKKVAIKTAQRNFTKTKEKIATIELELEENKAKIKCLMEAFNTAMPEASAILEATNKIKDEKGEIEAKKEELREVIQKLNSQKHKLTSEKMDIEHEIEQLAAALKEQQARLNSWKKDLASLTVSNMAGVAPCSFVTLSEEELRNLDVDAVKIQINLFDEQLKNMKPNLSSIAEYYKKEKLFLQRVEEMDAITKERDTQRSHYDNLRKQRLNEFMGGFQTITYKLKETYQMLTLGGDAELELVNSLDPFSDGIVFSVRPPRKSWKNISNLSGGEKTLSSLALVFALHYYKPTPFYVMDEIDAALDYRNVTIVGHYIKEQTKNAQFIVISLRNNMFELADRLVGIYKTYNISNSVAIDPQHAVCVENSN